MIDLREVLAAAIEAATARCIGAGDGSQVIVAGGSVHKIAPPRLEHVEQHACSSLESFTKMLACLSAAEPAEPVYVKRGAALSRGIGAYQERVTLQLDLHPRFADATRSRTLDQAALYELLSAYAREGMLEDGPTILSAIKTLRASKGTEHAAELDERGFYKVRGSTTTTSTTVAVPDRLVFTVPRWIGADAFVQRVEVALVLDIGERGITFSLRPFDLAVLEAQADVWLTNTLSMVLTSHIVISGWPADVLVNPHTGDERRASPVFL